jgi:arabinan endo-1,5-alpha-L-arabinosidase
VATYQNPVVGFDSPDPDVLRPGSQYYVFTTASDYVNIPEYTSSDLSHWHHQPGDGLAHLPTWSTPGRTWAPGVVPLGGRWLMY